MERGRGGPRTFGMTKRLHGRSRLSQISVTSRNQKAASPLIRDRRGGHHALCLEAKVARFTGASRANTRKPMGQDERMSQPLKGS
jgi:hypothetical protein